MSIGRLELGEVEQTSFVDPINGEEIAISFRHATPGEIFGTLSDAGLSVDESTGDVSSKNGALGVLCEVEEANILLASRCIIHSSRPVTYRPALVEIGKYLREQSSIGDDEGKG